MAYDLEHGRRLELDWLTGKVRALGRTLGIPTPGERCRLHRSQAASARNCRLTVDRGPMSALGQKQTCAPQKAMSALPPIATAKADFRIRSCLLYPRKRTCAVQLRMSAMGQKRTCAIIG